MFQSSPLSVLYSDSGLSRCWPPTLSDIWKTPPSCPGSQVWPAPAYSALEATPLREGRGHAGFFSHTLDSSPSPPGSQPPTPSNARQGQPLHAASREPRVCGFRVVEASRPSSPVHRQLGHTWPCHSRAGGRFFQQMVGLPFQEKRLPRSRPGLWTLRHRALRGDCREAPSQVRERPLHKGAAPVG